MCVNIRINNFINAILAIEYQQQKISLNLLNMDGRKESFNDSVIGKSTSMSSSKPQNTRQFLNRFNKLPSYNAIHCKNHNQAHLQSVHDKNYRTNKKNTVLKLKLQQSNSRKRLSLGSSIRLESSRKSRLMNAFMNNREAPLLGDKYHSSLKKLIFNPHRQTVPLRQEIFKKMKIKSNIERLSLKINSKCHPQNEYYMMQTRQERYSFAPSVSPNGHSINDSADSIKNQQNMQVGLSEIRDCLGAQMRKSFTKLTFDDQYSTNVRHSKINSNLVSSNQISPFIQIHSHNPNISLKTLQRLSPIQQSQIPELAQISAESMKHMSNKQDEGVFMSNQNISKKTTKKSYNKFKIVKTELKETDKQNFKSKTQSSTKNSYIRSLIKTSNLETATSVKIRQKQNIGEDHHLEKQDINKDHKALGYEQNRISLLHPEGDFAVYFESQFNPW